MTVTLMWFRRDLRLADNPALLAAIEEGDDGVVPVYVLDHPEWRDTRRAQRAYLSASIASFAERTKGLYVVAGNPAVELPRLAAKVGATRVHAAAAIDPLGRKREAAVASAVAEAGGELVVTGSPYAIRPGRITKPDGDPYRVYTPFFRGWTDHGWRAPAPKATTHRWIIPSGGIALPHADPPQGMTLPSAGEPAALARWKTFLATCQAYGDERDVPGIDGTSKMSFHLALGEIHPRTLLHDLGSSKGEHAFRREIAFREFYADVLWNRPDTLFGYYNRQFEAMEYDEPGDAFEAWKAGRTGFPIVDAGMRQLLAEGWMHNRVRMIVASFLVKDLHVEWQHGSRHFIDYLADSDMASNQHGWQWVAGCGTDASPYFRIFNPTTQGKKFDPDGTYVRTYVPELAHLNTADIHEPWKLGLEAPSDYPAPIVDHAAERVESLERYQSLRA